MFSLMGNCCSCIRRKRQPKKHVTLAILGLDSAGKTTTTNALLGDDLNTAPTIGFNKEDIEFANYSFVLYDLGGGSKIRSIWSDYLNEIYGVIYVVDSSARERMGEVKENLWNLISHDMVKSKPVLILANKEDVDGHMDEVEIMQELQIEDAVNINKCPSKMVMCSAIKGTGKKMDKNINVGMTWLCGMLDQKYDTLKPRIDHDVEVIEARRAKERAERKERVKKQREERARQEEEENRRLGIKTEEVDDDDEDVVDGANPFRRLDDSEIQRKQEKAKLAKEKEKEKKRRLKDLDQENVNPAFTPDTAVNSYRSIKDDKNDNDDDDDFRVPRSNRSLGNLGLFNGAPLHKIGSDDDGDSDAKMPRSGRQLLPPLQSPLGTKFGDGGSSNTRDKKKKKKTKQKGGVLEEQDEYSTDNHVNDIDNYARPTKTVSKIKVLSNSVNEDSDDSDIIRDDTRNRNFGDSSQMFPKKKGKSKPQSLEGDDGFDTLRLSQHLDDVQEDLYSGRSSNQVKNSYSSGSNTPVKKLKKKNKHLRKNKTAPSDEEFELSDVQSPKKEPLPWGRSNSPMKMLNAVDDDQVQEGRWGFAEDLSAMDGRQPVIGSRRPNYDSDDPIL